MGQEIEIKLAIDTDHVARVWQALAKFAHRKPSTHRLYSAYYDTPDCLLKSNGVALRLRRDGRRWIQAVKSAGSAVGGLHRRAEHESPVAAQLPDFAAMAQAGFGELVADQRTRDALDVLFTTQFNRTSALFGRGGESVVEVSVDRGMIAAGDRRETICEIELELKAGNAAILFDLACELARQLPVRLDNRSKAQRGYALAAGVSPAPVKAFASGVTTRMSVEEAFSTVVSDCIAHLQANQAGLLAGRDAEYLHQARVALRRLRSACQVFRAVIPQDFIAQELQQVRAFSRLLGHARNLDVLALETFAHTDATDHAGMAALRRRVQGLRRQAGREARAAVTAPAYTIMLLQLVRKLVDVQARTESSALVGTRPRLQDFAADVMAHQYARLKKRGRNIERLAYPELHRLRIRVKRLRYAGEFFLPLAPRGIGDAMQSLGELQGLLGRLNDDAVTWKLLDTLATMNAQAQYQQAVGYVRGWCARDAELCCEMLKPSWQDFRKHKAWWKWT